MNYQEFRNLWHDALQAAQLQISQSFGPTEQINLRDMSRRTSWFFMVDYTKM
jgi:hypothetical protein